MKWIVTNCQSVGSIHDTCQDYTDFLQKDDIVVAALADGLSSNSLSDIGAKFFTKAACKEIYNHFDEYYNEKLSSQVFVGRLQESIKTKYDDAEVQQMKCTLLFCAISGNKYLLGHIGDGAILFFGEKSRVISRPQENEVGGTATYTILDCNASEHFKFVKGLTDRCDGFLLTSDGLLGNVYYGGQELPDFAYKLFGAIYNFDDSTSKEQRDSEFQNCLSENIQGDNAYADDCSIAIIARKIKTGIIDYDVVNGFEADVMWPCRCGQRNRMDSIRCSKCREMYLSVYSEDMIQIDEKESFFSKFNKWLCDDKCLAFSCEECATVNNIHLFDEFCKYMKKVYSNVVVENNFSTENNNSNSVTKTTDNKDIGVRQKQTRGIQNGSQNNTLIQIGKKICHGVSKCVGTLADNTICAITKIRKPDMQKSNSFTLKYNELVNLSYELGYLPVELTMTGENLQLSDDKKKVIELMYHYDVCLSYMEKSNNISKNSCEELSVQFYKKNNLLYLVSKIQSEDNFKVSAMDSNSDFVNRFIEKIDINKYNVANCNSKKIKVVLQWDWKKEFISSHNNLGKLYKSFCKVIMNQKNKLDVFRTYSNICWIVSKDSKACMSMCAVVLSLDRLFLLTANDEKKVSIAELSKEEIIDHIRSFITEQFFL